MRHEGGYQDVAQGADNSDASAASPVPVTLLGFRLNGVVGRHLMKLVGGAGLAHLILIASTPVVTRLYTPAQFGLLGLFASIVGVGAVVATAKYDFAIVSARTKSEAQHLLLGCFAVAIAIGGLTTAGMFLLRSLNVAGMGQLPVAAIWLCGLSIVFTAAFLSLRQWAIRGERFATVSGSAIAQSSGKSVAQMGLGGLGLAGGLIVAETLGRLAACVLYAHRLWPQLTQCAKAFRWRRLAVALGRNRRFPLFCLPSTLVNTVALHLPTPLVLYYFGAAEGGAFVMTWRILTLPVTVLGASISAVFHQKMADYATRRDDSALRLLDRTAMRLLAVGAVPTLLLFLLSKPVVTWALGANWALAGQTMAAIAPWMLAQFVVVPVSHTMSVYHSHHIKLLYDAATLLATGASIVVTAWLGGSYLLAMHILSWSNALAYVLFYALLRMVVARGVQDDRNQPIPLPIPDASSRLRSA